MAQMVVQIVARHAQIITVEAMQCVHVFFELVRGNDDIVTTDQVHTGLFVVSDQRITYPRIFVAMVQPDAVTAVIADRDSVDENFVDPPSVDAVPAFLVARDAEVGQAHSP